MDMLENALNACPDELWNERMWNDPGFPPEFSEFWYVAYHCLFWTDLYLSGAVEGFTPPAPFTLGELDPAGVLPDRQYTREELLAYLEHCRRKCRTTIEALTDERAQRICKFTWGEISFARAAAGQHAACPGTRRTTEHDPWAEERRWKPLGGPGPIR